MGAIKALLVTIFLSLAMFIGYMGGYEDGQKDVHSGKTKCVTLPDTKIYCYTRKNND